MTLPLFLAAHFVYGTVLGRVLFPRMRAEGEVLGPPLLLTLVPVALITAPIGAVLMRYTGGWFSHGLFVGQGNVAYERFHFGLLLGVIVGAGGATILGVFNVVFWASRDRVALTNVGVVLAAAVVAAVAAVDIEGLVLVRGTGGRAIWAHPAGLLSVAAVLVLGAWVVVCKRRFAAVPAPLTAPGMSVPKSTFSQPLL
jgi:hypothetical protein